MTLSARITQDKRRRGMTWPELADACEAPSRQALQQKISKRTLEEDLQMIRRLARALKVSPEWLAFGIKSKKTKTGNEK